MNIATLTVKMAADVASLKADMAKARGVVESAAGAMKRSLAGLGVAISAGAFVMMVKNAINAADEMSKLAKKIGVTTEQVAGLQIAFRQGGANAEALRMAMTKLAEGMVKGNEALDAMGLSAKNADGSLKSTRQMLGEVADKFKSYQDGAAKSSLASTLFGQRVGADLIPVLNSGSEALDRFDELARQLGLTVSDEVGKRAEEFNDTLDTIGIGLGAVGRKVAAELLPALQGLAGQFLKTAANGERAEKIAHAIAIAFKSLYIAVINIIEVFKSAGNIIGSFFSALWLSMQGEFRLSGIVLQEMAKEVVAGWKDTFAESAAIWKASGDDAVAAATKANAAINKLKDAPLLASANAKKAAAEAAKHLEELNRVLWETAGISSDFYKKWGLLGELFEKGALSVDELVKAQKKLLDQQPFMKELVDQQIKDAQSRNEELEAVIKLAEARSDTLDDIRFEIQLLQMSNTEREVATVMRQMEAKGMQAGTEAWREYEQAVRDAITARNLIRYQQDTARESANAWKDSAKDIQRALTDAFFRAAEHGKNLFETLRDAVKGMFNNLVLKPTLNVAAGGMTSMIPGLPGAVGADAEMAKWHQGATTIAASANPIMASLGSFGAGFTSSTASFAGAAGLWANGSYAASLGMGLSAALPWAAIAAVVYSVIKSKEGGPKAGGEFVTNVNAAGALTGYSGARLLFTPDNLDQDAEKYARATAQTVIAAIQSFGGSTSGLTIGAGFDTDPQGSAANRVAGILQRSGQTLYQSNREAGRDDADLQKQMADEVVRLTVAGIKAADLTGKVKAIFDSVDPDTSGVDALNRAIGDATAFRQLAAVFDLLGLNAEKLFDTVIEGVGGLQAAAGIAEGYYASTRTDQEKLTHGVDALRAQFEDLGAVMPESVEALRDYIESTDAWKNGLENADESTQSYILSIMALASPMRAVQDAAEALGLNMDGTAIEVDDLTDSTDDFGDAAARAAEALRAAIQNLQSAQFTLAGIYSDPIKGLDLSLDTYANKFAEIGLELPRTSEDIDNFADRLRAMSIAAKSTVQADSIASAIGLLSDYRNFFDQTLASATPEATEDNTDATNDLADAIRANIGMLQDQESTLRKLISTLSSFNESMLKLRQSLLIGPLSPLSPQDQYSAAMSNFMTLAQLAGTGDEFAMSELSGAATDLLDASRAMFASSVEYADDFQMVVATIDRVRELTMALEASKRSELSAVEAAIMSYQDELDSVNGQLGTANNQLAGIGLTLLQILEKIGNVKPTTTVQDTATSAISGWYMEILGRLPEAGDIAYWSERYRTGNTNDVFRDFINAANQADPGVIDAPLVIAVQDALDTTTTNIADAVVRGMAAFGSLRTVAATGTADDKAEWYAKQLSAGYTDEQLRQVVHDVIGVQSDSDWQYLRDLAQTVPGYAEGGFASPGWAMVGEQGPELMRIPAGGAQIMSNRDSLDALDRSNRIQSEEEAALMRQQNKLLDSIDKSLRRLGERSELVASR